MENYVAMLSKKNAEKAPKISKENAEKLFFELAENTKINVDELSEDMQNAANAVAKGLIKAYMSGSIKNENSEKGFRVVQETYSGVSLEYRLPVLGDYTSLSGDNMQRIVGLAGRLTGRGKDVIEKLAGDDMRLSIGLSGFFMMGLSGL